MGELLVAALLNAGIVEAIISGGRYHAGDEHSFSTIGIRTAVVFCLSLAGFYFFGWIPTLVLVGVFVIRILLSRGKTERYVDEPDRLDINYGEFQELAEKRMANAPTPDDATLRELVERGKIDEARSHAREMMQVARSVGDAKRERAYRDWLAK
jgi:hypothetical protein